MVITISRQYGAGGSDVAQLVAKALIGWSVVDNELVERVAADTGLTTAQAAAHDERAPSFVERLTRLLASSTPELVSPPGGTVQELDETQMVRVTERVVAELAERGRVILVGRAAPVVLSREKDAIHVKLVAPRTYRVHAASQRLGIDPAEAARLVADSDATRDRYHREYYGRDWNDAASYHMVLNTGLLGLRGAAALIIARARTLGWATERRTEGGGGDDLPGHVTGERAV
jgi:CMP/dCMP kinase